MKGNQKMNVLIYTQPACSACEATKEFMEMSDITYQTVPMNAENRDRFRDAGFRQAPVVEILKDDELVDVWAGFQYEKIEALARNLNGEGDEN